MSYTDDLNILQGNVNPGRPMHGQPTTVWAADVTVLHADGTVDAQPVQSRASKVNVQVPVLHSPKVGDRILVANLNGDTQLPIMVGAITATTPTVTGSKGGNAALASLITALSNRGWIIDNTT